MKLYDGLLKHKSYWDDEEIPDKSWDLLKEYCWWHWDDDLLWIDFLLDGEIMIAYERIESYWIDSPFDFTDPLYQPGPHMNGMKIPETELVF